MHTDHVLLTNINSFTVALLCDCVIVAAAMFRDNTPCANAHVFRACASIGHTELVWKHAESKLQYSRQSDTTHLSPTTLFQYRSSDVASTLFQVLEIYTFLQAA